MACCVTAFSLRRKPNRPIEGYTKRPGISHEKQHHSQRPEFVDYICGPKIDLRWSAAKLISNVQQTAALRLKR